VNKYVIIFILYTDYLLFIGYYLFFRKVAKVKTFLL